MKKVACMGDCSKLNISSFLVLSKKKTVLNFGVVLAF